MANVHQILMNILIYFLFLVFIIYLFIINIIHEKSKYNPLSYWIVSRKRELKFSNILHKFINSLRT